jgi:hypothetical protein
VKEGTYFTGHLDSFPALIPWFSTGSMVSLIPSFITYRIIHILQGQLVNVNNQSINQFRRPGPVWAFAISWLNLLWWRVGVNPVNLF